MYSRSEFVVSFFSKKINLYENVIRINISKKKIYNNITVTEDEKHNFIFYANDSISTQIRRFVCGHNIMYQFTRN